MSGTDRQQQLVLLLEAMTPDEQLEFSKRAQAIAEHEGRAMGERVGRRCVALAQEMVGGGRLVPGPEVPS